MVAPGAFLQRIDPLNLHLSVLSIALIFKVVKNDAWQSNKLPCNGLAYFPTSVAAPFLEKRWIKVF